jgi:lipopolysaccharide export system permease protein
LRLQRAILGELFSNFLLAVLVLGSVSVAGVLVQSTGRYSEVPLGVIVGGIPFFVVGLLPHLLPVCLLSSILLTYGRMAAEGEVAALRASGVHLFRVISPAFALAFTIAALNEHVLGEAIPRLYLERPRYLRRVAAAALEGRATVISRPTFYLEGTPTGSPGVRRDAILFLRGQGEEEREGDRWIQIATAREARTRIDQGADELVATFSDMKWLRKQRGSAGATTGEVGSITTSYPLEHLLEGRREIVKERDLPSPELWASLLRGGAKRPPKATFELERRAALAAAPIIFAMIGAPLGILLRRGNRLFAFAVAFGVVLLGYYPLLVFGETFFEAVVKGREAPEGWPLVAASGAWIADAVLGALGAVLLWRLFRL